MKKLPAFAVSIVALVLVAGTSPALAYLAPGTGSILLQIIFGGVAG